MLKIVLSLLLLVVSANAAIDPAVLMQADRDFAKATEAKGLDGWMEYMAPNAVLLRDTPQVGPKNIRLSLEKSFNAPGFHLTWEPQKAEFVGPNADLGYTIGRYEVRTLNGGRASVEHGSYLTTWLKQKDGSWKVVSDIGSPDTRPRPTPQRAGAPQKR